MKRTPAKTSPAEADPLAGACATMRIAPVKIMPNSQNATMMP